MQYFRFAITVFFLQIETLTYLIVNWVTSAFRSVSLLTPADEAQPLRPRSLWAYLSLVPYCLLMFFEFRSYRQLMRILTCLWLDSALAYGCFFRWPSAYPRPALPALDDAKLRDSWRALHKMDRPGNTFPSLHVSHVYLLALIMSRQVPRGHAEAYFAWATVVSLSTVITKQHYLVDVTGGLMLAEEIMTHVYEPLEEGRFSFREAWAQMRKVNDKLNALGQRPQDFRLALADRHPRVVQLLADYRACGSFAGLFDGCSERAFLFERKAQLLELLRGIRPYIKVANKLMPGLLQFIEDMEEADPLLHDASVRAYLLELDEDLKGVMDALFEYPEASVARRASGIRPLLSGAAAEPADSARVG